MRKKIAKARGRSVAEWIGKTPDTRPPQRIVLRVFDRAKGVCHISDVKIAVGDKWHVDHVKALEDGGENRESNLAPALDEPHSRKTAAENKARAKERKQRARHIGIKKPTKKIESRGFDKSEREPKAGKYKIQKLPVPGIPEIARRYQPK